MTIIILFYFILYYIFVYMEIVFRWCTPKRTTYPACWLCHRKILPAIAVTCLQLDTYFSYFPHFFYILAKYLYKISKYVQSLIVCVYFGLIHNSHFFPLCLCFDWIELNWIINTMSLQSLTCLDATVWCPLFVFLFFSPLSPLSFTINSRFISSWD